MSNETIQTSMITLNNGVEMPRLGLGTFRAADGREVRRSVQIALNTGYRLIDTAAVYGNESGVGEALSSAGLAREHIFVTTKVWNSDQGYDSTLRAFDTSLQKLQLDVLDLYLIHWPVSGKFVDTWRAMEELYEAGRVRAIGVSNFLPEHLDELMQSARITPAVNQVEFHPYLQSEKLLAACRDLGIIVEAWSPLMKGEIIRVPELVELGKRIGKTAAQVTIRWMLQKDVVTIPKSTHEHRIRENADVFDFSLSKEDITLIDSLDRDRRFGPDPATFAF